MAELYHTEDEPQLICWDRKNYSYFEDQLEALKNSKTVYVGNLSFFSNEQQILETFNTVGPVKRLIMGLNSIQKTPCGFCFVEYYNQEHYHAALNYISDSVCDERPIRCDADGGFLPGRQFGRGRSGGQVRDERKNDYDPARGRFLPPSVFEDYSNNDRGNRKRNRDSFDHDHRRSRGNYRDNYNKNYDNYRGGRNDHRRVENQRDSRGNGGSLRQSLDSELSTERR